MENYRKSVFALVAASGCLAAGCSTVTSAISPEITPEPISMNLATCGLLAASVRDAGAPESKLAAEIADTLNCDEESDDELIGDEYFTTVGVAIAASEITAEKERELANALLNSLVSQSDKKCDEYMTKISAQWNGTTSTLGVVDALANAAGAISFGGQTNEILSAVSGGAQGSRTVLSKAIFGEQAYPLIREAVTDAREEMKAEKLGPANAPTADAPSEITTVAQALSFATEYHTQCGTSLGVARLERALKSASAQKAANDAEAASEKADEAAQKAESAAARAEGAAGADSGSAD